MSKELLILILIMMFYLAKQEGALNSSVFANNSMTLNSNKPTPRGPIGATLKAIKALSPSLRHGGTCHNLDH
ncbi:hypothetical protein ACO1DO_00360 [Staphylococcus aureus]|uniref:hypothetical protein n=1 Tax=Staphylococcus aureus TaxID=1280 RepID=UPI003BF65B7F